MRFINSEFKKLGSLAPEEKKEFASSLNKIKDDLTSQIELKFLDLEKQDKTLYKSILHDIKILFKREYILNKNIILLIFFNKSHK